MEYLVQNQVISQLGVLSHNRTLPFYSSELLILGNDDLVGFGRGVGVYINMLLKRFIGFCK